MDGILYPQPQGMLDPKTLALLQAGFSLMSNSGPSKTPIPLGTALGQAGLAGLGGYTQAAQQNRQNAQTEAMINLERQKAALVQQQAARAQMQLDAMKKLPEMIRKAREGQAQPVQPVQPMQVAQNGISDQSASQIDAPWAAASSLPQAAQQAPAAPQPQPTDTGLGKLGDPAGGLPMEYWFAVDPTGQKYAEQLAKDNAAISTRYGIFQKGQNGQYNPVGGALPAGALPYQFGPNGQVDVNPYPGQVGGTASLAAAKTGGEAYGAAPYKTEVLNTPGAPRVATQQQVIESATGQPMQPPLGMRPQGNAPGGSVMFKRPFSPILQDQGQGAEQRQYGEVLGKQAGLVNEAAAQAAISNRYLSVVDQYSTDFNPGKLAPLQSSVIQWSQALGMPVTEQMQKEAGSVQGLTSISIRLAGQLTRQSDAQPSQLQFLKNLEAMPSSERTADGLRKIVAYMRDTNNMAIAKAQALQEWKRTHMTADGFEAAWPKQAAKMPFIWNRPARASDNKPAPESSPSPQDIADELRRRGVIK